jgi:hypothetical protein
MALLLFAAPVSPTAAASPAKPASPLNLNTLIHVVFIGYDMADVDLAALRGALPATYVPVVRYPQFYGLPGRDLGIQYNFRYKFTKAHPKLERDFFKFLSTAGTTGDLTEFQQAYNDQENNRLDVTGPVRYIDGPSVEAWLAARSPSIPNGYTIYFINWYEHPDFQFHVYTKTDEPDPDTGVNFGQLYDDRKLVAWGGTSSRAWFYDHSAGPEAWAGNFNVDDADLDGDDVPDYRIPPIWEYAPDGYRDPGGLTGDLARLARYVAINLLFTPSPLYDPLATRPGPGGDKIVHVAALEDDPARSALDWIDAALIQHELQAYQPYYDWQVHVKDHDPIDAGAQRALRIFAGLLEEDDCWNAYGTPFAQLFCYFDANRGAYLPAYDAEDYVLGMFAFNTTDENMGDWFGLLGFADDNWVDGTQTYVFEFNYPAANAAGYGLTTTSIHEGGHHFGASHPHDGYDSEQGIDYGPGGDFFFAWAGDESHSIMQYLALTNEFGVFDRDNALRWETASALAVADELAAQISAHPDGGALAGVLTESAAARGQALAAFQVWDFAGAAQAARAYEASLAGAAAQLGIASITASAASIPAENITHQIDPIRILDEQ